MSQPYQINNNIAYNTNSRNNFSVGKSNTMSYVKSNHSLIMYQNHLIYEESKTIQSISTQTTRSEPSTNDRLFGLQNTKINIISPPSYIKYRV